MNNIKQWDKGYSVILGFRRKADFTRGSCSRQSASLGNVGLGWAWRGGWSIRCRGQEMGRALPGVGNALNL